MGWRCIVAAAGLLLSSGCLLELDTEVSCGDGYVDRGAGEECEPDEPRSFEDACRSELRINRPGACDPVSCQLDLTACFPLCGNEMKDPGEECDPGAPDSESGDQFAGQVSCKTLSPHGNEAPYTGGILRDCQADCTWDRTPCHRCGDGIVQPEEVCDGDGTMPSLDPFDEFCMSACVDRNDGDRPEAVQCAASCADDCSGFVIDDDYEARGCCIPNNKPAHPDVDCCGFEDKATGMCIPGVGGG